MLDAIDQSHHKTHVAEHTLCDRDGHITQHMLRSVSILDVVETSTDAKRALAHSGVLKACSKLAAHKAAHSAVHALRAEPSSLSSSAGIRRPRNAQACWVKGPQARALAD